MTSIQTPQEPEDSRQVVRGIDEQGNLVFKQIGVEELNYFGRWGAIATSGTENTVAIGEHYFVLDDNSGDKFRVGDEVLCIAPDRDCFLWGSVIGKDEAGGAGGSPRLLVFADDISNARGTFADWELQVVGRPKFAITKDSSVSSVNPTAAGPFTLTVTAGKFFPIGGKLLLVPIEAPTIALVGKVKAYSGTSLIVEKNSTNATVSTSYTSWAIALLDAPQDLLPLFHMSGLRVVPSGDDLQNDFVIYPGTVLDSTGTTNLTLDSVRIKKLDAVFTEGNNQGAAVKSANLTGTISSVGTTVTGTGTNFETAFGDLINGNFLTDINTQFQALGNSDAYTVLQSIITSGDNITRTITTINSTTELITNTAISASGDTFARGGPIGTLTGGASYYYGVGIARRDSDGHIEPFATAFTPSGAPDLPSGYTYFRLVAVVTIQSGVQVVYQPLKEINGLATDQVLHYESSGSGSPLDGVLTNLILGASPAASTTQSGFVELATSAETITGTDTDRAVTPAGHAAAHPSGTYTPTFNNTTNIDASTAAAWTYYRVGDAVTVSGNFLVDPTAAAATELRATLPIASTFVTETQLGGTAASKNIAGQAVAITGSTANRACFHWVAAHTNNQRYSFSFTYLVV